MDLERPLRNPDVASAPLMSKRARWLVLLGFVLPGSAQLLAGSRRLGRFGVTATVVLVLFGVLALIGLSSAREFTLSVFTNSIVLLVLQGVIAAYAVLWLVLGFDTLRLTRLVRVSPNWRIPVAMLSILLTIAPVLGAGWALTAVGSVRGAIGDIFGGGAPAVEPVDGRYNILLLGTDAGEDREGLRPDSISLVSVDAETGQSVIVGLPRELIEMPFPETSPMYSVHPNGFGVAPNAFDEDWDSCLTTCYLNALYTEVEVLGDPVYEGFYADSYSRGSSPGIEATKDAVSGATGLTVQFYVLIDMEGFAALIDALGGVTIDVKEPIPVGGREDEYGDWVDIAWYIEPGLQTLNGENAQWYARSRHGSERGDYDRMDRQRELQAAILAQMSPSNVLSRFQEIASAGANLVETDIPESMLGRFVTLADKAKEYTPLMVQLTPPDVDPEYPDYSLIHQLVADGVAAASPAPEPGEEAATG